MLWFAACLPLAAAIVALPVRVFQNKTGPTAAPPPTKPQMKRSFIKARPRDAVLVPMCYGDRRGPKKGLFSKFYFVLQK